MFNDAKEAIDLIKKAVESPVRPVDINLRGFSVQKSREMLNTLCSKSGTNYLEIGTWYGSTLVSAAYKNDGVFYGIDNFSQFQNECDVREELRKWISTYINDCGKIRFMEGDCFTMPLEGIKDIDVFFYDGNHSAEATRNALVRFKDLLSPVAIVVLDDYEFVGSVKEGLDGAINGWNIVYQETPKKAEGFYLGFWVGVVVK